jgi:hypothetical protein
MGIVFLRFAFYGDQALSDINTSGAILFRLRDGEIKRGEFGGHEKGAADQAAAPL